MKDIKRKLYMITLLSFLIMGCATPSQAKNQDSNSRQYYVESHPELSPDIKQAILKGKVIVGMTKEGVRAVWGEPTRTLEDPNADEEHGEAWYYDQTFWSLAPRKFVEFNIHGLVVYVSEHYK